MTTTILHLQIRWSDILTDRIFLEYMLKYDRNVHRKNRTRSQLRAEKIAFPPKPNIRTGGYTDRHKQFQSSFTTKNLQCQHFLPVQPITDEIGSNPVIVLLIYFVRSLWYTASVKIGCTSGCGSALFNICTVNI